MAFTLDQVHPVSTNESTARQMFRTRQEGHCPCFDLATIRQERNVKRVRLSCAVCAVEESVLRKLKIKTSRMFSTGQKGMAYCKRCKLPAHNTIPSTAIRLIKGCENLTCFEIMHLPSNHDLWFKYNGAKGKH